MLQYNLAMKMDRLPYFANNSALAVGAIVFLGFRWAAYLVKEWGFTPTQGVGLAITFSLVLGFFLFLLGAALLGLGLDFLTEQGEGMWKFLQDFARMCILLVKRYIPPFYRGFLAFVKWWRVDFSRWRADTWVFLKAFVKARKERVCPFIDLVDDRESS